MEEQEQKLSEGFDFIEESCGLCDVPLSFEETDDTITEAEETRSPYKIIGICKGVFQPCGEFSRNNRLYEADHWVHILGSPVFQDRLKSRDLLGMVGHMDKRIDDKDIAEGKVSHVVSKLEIRENQEGKPYLYGELEIFDTPAGRNLKALYEGGANLYVSSRGAGKLLPVPGQTYKKVDKNSYFCETFDVVRRPGFLQAHPVYEGVHENAQVNEEVVNELNDETVSKDVEKRINNYWDTQAEKREKHKEAVDAEKKLDNAIELARKKAEREGKHFEFSIEDGQAGFWDPKDPTQYESLEVLKSQVDKLTKIVEKVVDDVYEVEEPVKENKEITSEALADFITLMAETNISEESFEEIIDMIAKSKEIK